MKSKQKRTLQKYKMRDYRSQLRLAKLKNAILILQEKKKTGEVVLSGDAKKIFFSAVQQVLQI